MPFGSGPLAYNPDDERTFGGSFQPPTSGPPGGSFGVGGAGSFYSGVGYDPSSPLFGRRRRPGANRMASFMETPVASQFGGPAPMQPMGSPMEPGKFGSGQEYQANPFQPPGQGGNFGNPFPQGPPQSRPPQDLGGTVGGYDPYAGQDSYSMRTLLEQMINRMLAGDSGGGVMDPTGETNPMLRYLQDDAERNAGHLQQGARTRAQLMDVDPAQMGYMTLQGDLNNRGATADMLSGARMKLGMNAQDIMRQLFQMALGREGVQGVGKYDASRSGQGGLDFGGMGSALGAGAGAFFGAPQAGAAIGGAVGGAAGKGPPPGSTMGSDDWWYPRGGK